MKVIKRTQMPDGTEIQIEDWKENYSFIKTISIGAYPKAKNSSETGFIERNRKFRLSLCNFESDKQVESIFNQLEKGYISLEELSNYFREGHRDMYYLGMVETEEIQEEQDEEEL
mgnify:CR=1 FL=1